MPLVIGAFTTLSEAEQATRALLDDGLTPEAISAVGRAGGGRLLLAGRVPVLPVGEPARLVNRTERISVSALIGAIGGGLLTALAVFLVPQLLPEMGADPLAPLAPLAVRDLVPSGMVRALEVLVGAALGATAGALVQRTRGLPHDLAMRYALRLDQGDTIVAVRVGAAGEARAAQETMAMQGAIQAHVVTAGTLEPVGEPPTPAGLTPGGLEAEPPGTPNT